MASGVVGAVDRWLSGPASRSSALAVITQTLRIAVPWRCCNYDDAEVCWGCSGAGSAPGTADRQLVRVALERSRNVLPYGVLEKSAALASRHRSAVWHALKTNLLETVTYLLRVWCGLVNIVRSSEAS